MADKYDVSNPTLTNLSKLIDEDLQKESQLLQDLIGDVVDANQKLKSAHQKRLEESQEKLRILNADISRLKKGINDKEHETSMKQLNALIDSKNKIFEALQSIRRENIDSFVNTRENISIKHLETTLFKTLKDTLASEDVLTPYAKQVQEPLLTFLTDFTDNLWAYFDMKAPLNQTLIQDLDAFNQTLHKTQTSMLESVSELTAVFNDRHHLFHSEQTEDISLDERLNQTITNRITRLEEDEQNLKTTRDETLNDLDVKLQSIYEDTLNDLTRKHQKKIKKETDAKSTLEDDIQQLKIKIIYAEKTGQEDTLKALLKTYNKRIKANQKLMSEKLEDKAQTLVKTQRKKLIKQAMNTEIDFERKRTALRFEKAKAQMAKQDSSELFKLKEDYQSLNKDKTFNQALVDYLKTVFNAQLKLFEQALSFMTHMHEIMLDKHDMIIEQQISSATLIHELKNTYKDAQMTLSKALKLKYFEQRSLKKKLLTAIDKHSLTIKHHQTLAAYDKALTDTTKQTNIEQLGQQETIKNDMIYEQARIELADKEHELQLIKIQALYDSEMNLTKAQAERLDVGHDVNEAMVGTTLKSQINFAKQQLKYAESEYNLRLDNIDQALKREQAYAEEKLIEHQQPYKTDRLEFIKERDRKLEDLAYKLALFTEDKDKKALEAQQEAIKAQYREKLDEIDHLEKQNETVQRYQSHIDRAKKRASHAREDAKKIYEKTVETFESMLEVNEEKLRQFKAQAEQTSLAPYIEQEATSTAKERLDEAIEEAKAMYEDKVKGPKARLKALKDKQDKLFTNAENQAEISTIEAKKADEQKAYQDHITALEKQMAEALADVENDKIAFLDKHHEKAKTIKTSNRPEISKKRLIKQHKQTKQHLKQTFKQEKTAQKNDYQKQINTNMYTLDKQKQRLDAILEPTIKTYQQLLHKVTQSQSKREQAVKKSLEKDMRQTIKSIRASYKDS